MVKLFALNILYKGHVGAIWLQTSYDLKSFNIFKRGSVQEFMAFVSKTVVDRTQTASRQSIKEGDYMCHVYVRGDNLAAVVISDHEYPNRVSHTLMSKVLDDFASKYPASSWPTGTEATMAFPQLSEYLATYQTPREADAITRMQEDLDETKIIMHRAIESVLERGEKLDDLVAKSEELTERSKEFYTIAKKANSCCKF